MGFQSVAQKEIIRSKDGQNGAVVLQGELNAEIFENEAEFIWFREGLVAYHPDQQTIDLLKKELPKYDLTIVLGTWCEDSHALVPKLVKVLQLSDYPLGQLRMVGVDRSKKSEALKGVSVDFVPTIIVYEKGEEIGRIVETTRKSIEIDLAEIIQQH